MWLFLLFWSNWITERKSLSKTHHHKLMFRMDFHKYTPCSNWKTHRDKCLRSWFLMSDTIFSKNQNAILHHTNTWITFQFDSQQSIRAILYYFHVSLSNQFTKTLHPYVLLEQSLILRVLCYAMISCVWFLIQRNVNRKKVSFALSLSLSRSIHFLTLPLFHCARDNHLTCVMTVNEPLGERHFDSK